MIQSRQTYTGTNYVATVALLACGLVFSPALLVLSGPISPGGGGAAFGMSMLCLAIARVSWSRSSNLTIASVVR